MQRPAPFFHDDDLLEPGHRLEQRSRDRPRRNRQPRVRVALDQVAEQTGRQHGIADARRGNKQDVHFARVQRPYIPTSAACQAGGPGLTLPRHGRRQLRYAR